MHCSWHHEPARCGMVPFHAPHAPPFLAAHDTTFFGFWQCPQLCCCLSCRLYSQLYLLVPCHDLIAIFTLLVPQTMDCHVYGHRDAMLQSIKEFTKHELADIPCGPVPPLKRYPEPHDHGGVYNRSPCAH